MSDSEHSTVTYTSVSEDDSDIGSPGVDGPPIMPELTKTHTLLFRVRARNVHPAPAPAPFLSEDVLKIVTLPTLPPSPLSPYSIHHLLPQIPSPSPPLPISSPPPNGPTYAVASVLTPGPGYEVGESSAAGTARQVGPTTAEADLYGFADMLDAAPRRRTSKELGYGITDTWDDLVGAIQEIAPTTLEGVQSEGISPSTKRSLAQQSEITELQAADRRRQSVISDLLKADYRRQRQLVETLKIVK
ncbi:hypothetical protein Tco_1476842 [Tanacetum coccineum]